MVESEGQDTNIIVNFVLENQGIQSLSVPIPILFSGYLFHFERPFIGMELKLNNNWYVVTRFLAAQRARPNDPLTDTYFVEPLIKRPDTSKNTSHLQYKFVDNC
jgi:hypothetical protein